MTTLKTTINMNSEAFAAWASLYNDSFADIFVSEEKELKRVAMILSALKQEFSRIESGLQEKFCNLKHRVCDKKFDKETATGIVSEKNTVENTASIDLCTPSEGSNNSELPASLNLLKPDVGLTKTKISNTFYEQKDRSVHRKKKLNSSSNNKYSPLTEASSSKKTNNENKKENRRSDETEKVLEKPKQFAYKTETVRGKGRLQLPGWSCKECEEFYEALDLSPKTKKAKMNACSKHRGKFKPTPDTPKGFWDMTFPPTPNTEFK